MSKPNKSEMLKSISLGHQMSQEMLVATEDLIQGYIDRHKDHAGAIIRMGMINFFTTVMMNLYPEDTPMDERLSGYKDLMINYLNRLTPEEFKTSKDNDK